MDLLGPPFVIVCCWQRRCWETGGHLPFDGLWLMLPPCGVFWRNEPDKRWGTWGMLSVSKKWQSLSLSQNWWLLFVPWLSHVWIICLLVSFLHQRRPNAVFIFYPSQYPIEWAEFHHILYVQPCSHSLLHRNGQMGLYNTFHIRSYCPLVKPPIEWPSVPYVICCPHMSPSNLATYHVLFYSSISAPLQVLGYDKYSPPLVVALAVPSF